MTTNAKPRTVRPGHHDRGVPPDVGPDPALGVLIAWEPGLALGRNRVDVVRAAQAGDADLLLARPFEQPEHDVPGPGAAAGPHHVVERFQPLPGLVWVDVGKLGGQAVADNRVAQTLAGCMDAALPVTYQDGTV